MKKKFGYENLATVDDDMRAKAIEWIKQHAKDPKPFFVYLCFEKVHNPNNPSPRWKGKSPGGGNYLDALMELDDNSGQVVQALRDVGLDREHHRGLDHGQRRMGRCLARCRVHAFPRHEGLPVRRRVPSPCHRVVAGKDQARFGQHGHVLAHGLVADPGQDCRPRGAPA